MKSNKKAVGENARAFCLGRTESIPAVLTVKNFTKKNTSTGGSAFFVTVSSRWVTQQEI